MGRSPTTKKGPAGRSATSQTCLKIDDVPPEIWFCVWISRNCWTLWAVVFILITWIIESDWDNPNESLKNQLQVGGLWPPKGSLERFGLGSQQVRVPSAPPSAADAEAEKSGWSNLGKSEQIGAWKWRIYYITLLGAKRRDGMNYSNYEHSSHSPPHFHPFPTKRQVFFISRSNPCRKRTPWCSNYSLWESANIPNIPQVRQLHSHSLSLGLWSCRDRQNDGTNLEYPLVN